LLNFGHTLGHAIENVSGYRGSGHGEAISMGMVFASRLSEKLGIAPAGVSERLKNLIERIGLPAEPPDWRQQRSAYVRAIAVDKKISGRKVGFVVLREIGSAEVFPLSPEEILRGGA
jgi:3-dehydroquinate synthase